MTLSVKSESNQSDFLSFIKEVIQDEGLSSFVSFSFKNIDFVCGLFDNVCEPTQLKGISLHFLMFGVDWTVLICGSKEGLWNTLGKLYVYYKLRNID